MDPGTRQLVKALKKQGITTEHMPGGHLKAFRPEDPKKFVTLASTTRYPRAFKNQIALLRRELGFVWKGR